VLKYGAPPPHGRLSFGLEEQFKELHIRVKLPMTSE
jgi:hypothetical protein